MKNSIYIKGARENNLKNVDLEIPRDKLIVFTGISGSVFLPIFSETSFSSRSMTMACLTGSAR